MNFCIVENNLTIQLLFHKPVLVSLSTDLCQAVIAIIHNIDVNLSLVKLTFVLTIVQYVMEYVSKKTYLLNMTPSEIDVASKFGFTIIMTLSTAWQFVD